MCKDDNSREEPAFFDLQHEEDHHVHLYSLHWGWILNVEAIEARVFRVLGELNGLGNYRESDGDSDTQAFKGKGIQVVCGIVWGQFRRG